MSRITRFGPQAPAVIMALTELTEDLKKSSEETHTFLEARFGCWGDDDTGKQFGEQYIPGYQRFWGQSKDLIDGLEKSAGDLKGIQASFAETDQRNADNIR